MQVSRSCWEQVGAVWSGSARFSRLYISHAHPDHFAGASLVDAPAHALAAVRDRINQTATMVIPGAYLLTGTTDIEPWLHILAWLGRLRLVAIRRHQSRPSSSTCARSWRPGRPST
jgi:glyoxylase-like metal-dependent hydrolase (beta-lactamase superfamily II)